MIHKCPLAPFMQKYIGQRSFCLCAIQIYSPQHYMDPEMEKVRIKHSQLVQVSQYCPERPLLEFKIPTSASEVTKVVVRSISHDQGN